MSSSFFRSFYVLIFSIVLITLFVSCFFGPSILMGNSDNIYYYFDSNDEYVWPAPGYTYITSHFGRRSSPTARCKYIS